MGRRVRGGYIGADLTPRGQALGTTAVQKFGLKSGDKAIVFGAWGQPGRFFREEGTAQALEHVGSVAGAAVGALTVGSTESGIVAAGLTATTRSSSTVW